MSSSLAHDLTSRLRAETREAHSRIETNPLHRAIVEGRVTVVEYAALLEKMRAFHLQFENLVGTRPEWRHYNFDFDERRKTASLERDLAALQQPDLTAAIIALPLESATFPFIAGYLYVLEGSTLGGQILIRLLNQQLGITPATGGVYFTSYGPAVGRKWKECQDLLERIGGSSAIAADEMIAGASDAFSRLDRWLRRGTL